MCRLALMSGINDDNREKAWQLMLALKPYLISDGGNTDGFGYAAITGDGDVYGERWHDPKDAFELSPDDYKLIDDFGIEVLDDQKQSDSFGEVDFGDAVAVCMHSRYSTNERVFENTHPFHEGNTAIVHNGMIRNHATMTKKYSTCDSEVILHEYIASKVGEDPRANFQDVADKLVGYYAVGVLSQDEDGEPVMDVFKANNAGLVATFIEQLGIYVLCTAKSIIVDALKDLKWDHDNRFFKIKNDTFIRFNAKEGTPIDTFTFESESNWNSTYGFKANASDSKNTGSNTNYGTNQHSGSTESSWWKNKNKDESCNQGGCANVGTGATSYSTESNNTSSSSYSNCNLVDSGEEVNVNKVIFTLDQLKKYANSSPQEILSFQDDELHRFYLSLKILSCELENDMSKLDDYERKVIA